MTTPDPAPAPAALPEPPAGRATSGIRGALLALAVGVAAAVLGLLPWILAGLRLPLQNLWREQITDAGDMPIALLPFNQYTAGLLAAVILVGGGIAGAAARALRSRLPRHGSWLVVAGLLLVQVVALVQTSAVTADGLGMDDVPTAGTRTGATISEAQVYLVAFVGGTAAMVLLAGLVAALLARAPAGVAVAAAAVPVVLLGSWLGGLVSPGATGMLSDAAYALLPVISWVPPVVLGVAVALTGLRSAGRVVGSVVAVLLLWVGTAVVVGVTYALGNRALLRYPLELLDAGGAVGGAVLRGQGGVLGQLAVAVAVAVGIIGALVVRAVRRRRAVGAG
jgi:iron complex transport system permease protein